MLGQELASGGNFMPPASPVLFPLSPEAKRMLKYHSSLIVKGFTPRVIGWSGNAVNFGSQIGLHENMFS